MMIRNINLFEFIVYKIDGFYNTRNKEQSVKNKDYGPDDKNTDFLILNFHIKKPSDAKKVLHRSAKRR